MIARAADGKYEGGRRRAPPPLVSDANASHSGVDGPDGGNGEIPTGIAIQVVPCFETGPASASFTRMTCVSFWCEDRPEVGRKRRPDALQFVRGPAGRPRESGRVGRPRQPSATLAGLEPHLDTRDRLAGADAGNDDVTLPSVSFQISSAVVFRWNRRVGRELEKLMEDGLAGNLSRHSSSAWRSRLHYLRSSVSTTRADGFEQLPPARCSCIGHREDELVPSRGRRRPARCRCCRSSAHQRPFAVDLSGLDGSSSIMEKEDRSLRFESGF